MRLLELYDELSEQPTGERAAMLARLREREPTLAAELEQLITGTDTLLPSEALAERWSETDDATEGVTSTATLTGGGLESRPRATTGPNQAVPELTRYQLLGPLGRGGAGQVFRARDRETDEEVAVKLLRPELVDNAKSVLRFRREFRAVARLDHPHCIRVLDEGFEAEHRYYVMEYLRGGDLRGLVGAPPTTLLIALIQVAAALDYIHGQRIVHRDIKPANVLVERRDPPRVKLADFGIALRQAADVTQLTGAGQVLGTVDYMSPEQVEGQPLDPRSDLYSLGCMMWQLFCGRLPFEGNTVQRLVGRVYGTATPLHQLRPELPDALSELVARLLARDPAERPQSALEVVEALARILAEVDPDAAAELLGELPTDRAGAFLFAAPLCGRASELARLQGLATAAHGGEPEVPVVAALVGPAGFGKRGLIEQLRAREPKQGVAPTVLRLSVDADQARPLAPFPALAQALGAGEEQQRSWIAEGRELLAEDELRRARSRQVEWLATRLRARASEKPAVVTLENFHHASNSAWTLLAELARALAGPGPRPLIVLTVVGEAQRHLTELRAELEHEAAVATLELRPLAAEDVAAMVTGMLGVGISEQPENLAELAFSESRGSPLVVRSFLEDLVERELLRRVPGGWALAPELGQLRPARELLLARLDHLAPETLALLELAALVGGSFDTELLLAISEARDVTVLDALDEALRASVIRSVKGSGELDSFAFEHEHFVDELERRCDPERRTRAHAAIATVLRERGVPASVLVRHYEAAGDRPGGYRAMREAADEAREALDFETAAQRLTGALAWFDASGAGEPERAELRETLAETLVVIGRASEAVPLLREALAPTDSDHEGVREPLAEARLRRKLGRALLLANETGEGLVAMQAALAVLGDRSPRTRVGRFWGIARDLLAATLGRAKHGRASADPAGIERALVHRELALLYRYVDFERAATHVMAYRRLAERLGDPALRVESLAWYAVALAFLGRSDASARVDAAARRLAESVHGRDTLVRLDILRSGCLILRCEFDEAFAEMTKNAEQAEAFGDRFLLCFATSTQGWWYGLWGRFDLALDFFSRARRLAGEVNLQWLRVDAGCGQCIALAVSGRLDEAIEVSDEVIAIGRELGMPAVEAMAIEGRAIAKFLAGDYREAHSLEVQASEIYARHHLELGWGFSSQVFRYEALLLIEMIEGPDAVPELLDELRRADRIVRRGIDRIPLFHGYHDLLQGLIAARSGRPRRAMRLFNRALAKRDRLPPNGWDAWIRIRIAVERRRLGVHPAKAKQEFEAALVVAEGWSGAGMIDWLRRIRIEHDL